MGILVFKYISCYCLSAAGLPDIHQILLFKYISCYCLSGANGEWKNLRISIQIHLMLLFIFVATSQEKEVYEDSNTSHVIVYRISAAWLILVIHIQIHLMLLFIFTRRSGIVAIPNSNTSHVIVYPKTPQKETGAFLFKYISCYCLSISASLYLVSCFKFKYISCYCLS